MSDDFRKADLTELFRLERMFIDSILNGDSESPESKVNIRGRKQLPSKCAMISRAVSEDSASSHTNYSHPLIYTPCSQAFNTSNDMKAPVLDTSDWQDLCRLFEDDLATAKF